MGGRGGQKTWAQSEKRTGGEVRSSCSQTEEITMEIKSGC